MYLLNVGVYAFVKCFVFLQLLSYCNSSRCQIVTFDLKEFPSHVEQDLSHAYRPLIIQVSFFLFLMLINKKLTDNFIGFLGRNEVYY